MKVVAKHYLELDGFRGSIDPMVFEELDDGRFVTTSKNGSISFVSAESFAKISETRTKPPTSHLT